MQIAISEAADVINGGTPRTSVPEYWNGDIPWLSVKDFNSRVKYVSKTEKTITTLGLENSAANLLQPEDIILSARGTVGAIAKLRLPMACNQSCFAIRARPSIVDQDYLYYTMKDATAHLQALSQGSVFSTINRSTFDRWTVHIEPDIEKQQIIAAVLAWNILKSCLESPA